MKINQYMLMSLLTAVMAHLPLLNEDDLHLLVAYSLSNGEEQGEAVVSAFHAANIDVFKKPTKLVDWINTDVFDTLQWTSDRPLYLSTRIWDHQVVITAEEIRIYTQSPLISYAEEEYTRPQF